MLSCLVNGFKHMILQSVCLSRTRILFLIVVIDSSTITFHMHDLDLAALDLVLGLLDKNINPPSLMPRWAVGKS